MADLRGFRVLSTYPCKRDALPTELSAPTLGSRHLTGILGRSSIGLNGTERQRLALFGFKGHAVFTQSLVRRPLAFIVSLIRSRVQPFAHANRRGADTFTPCFQSR